MRRTRVLPGAIVLALAAVLGAPGAAFALFAGQPSAQTASVTAASIAAPMSFTAAATGSTTASLSWTAPSTLTGYTLSQSPGTLAGCSATPSSGTTSCTATGLSPKTTYTWTLTAVYDNWKSSSVQASATTFAVVGATLLGSATDTTSGTQATTVSGISTTSGAKLLILAYRQGSTGNLAINSITGTAVSGTPSQINTEPFTSGGNHFAVFAWQATGTGTSNGTVSVNFSSGNNTSTTIDVIQLSGNSAAAPTSAISTNTGTTATGGSLSPGSAADGEMFFAGLSGATSMTTPAGYAALDAPASTVHGAWFSASASSSAISTGLGASRTWGTIEVEISHG
jgi:hypothetical protein